ncbi:hypothetical protein ACFQWC_19835 [Rossellomorea sp. GCM10028870]
MKDFSSMSKSSKKAIRYIYQDAPVERLEKKYESTKPLKKD